MEFQEALGSLSDSVMRSLLRVADGDPESRLNVLVLDQRFPLRMNHE